MSATAGLLAELDPAGTIRLLGHDEHSHDEPHLVYVAMGVAHVRVDDVDVTLHANESVWLAPRVPHSARYEPGSLVLGPLLSGPTRPRGRFRRLAPMPDLTVLMTQVLAVAPHTPEQIALYRRELDALLGALSGPLFPLCAPRHPAAAAIARTAVRSDAPLAELAAAHRLSPRHVQRLFVEETSLPFRRWRVQARLNIAVERLNCGVSVPAAAAAAGYETVSGLRKALRREAGIDVADLRARDGARAAEPSGGDS